MREKEAALARMEEELRARGREVEDLKVRVVFLSFWFALVLLWWWMKVVLLSGCATPQPTSKSHTRTLTKSQLAAARERELSSGSQEAQDRLTYLKQAVCRYLSATGPEGHSERQALVPVICTILRFSAEETREARRAAAAEVGAGVGAGVGGLLSSFGGLWGGGTGAGAGAHATGMAGLGPHGGGVGGAGAVARRRSSLTASASVSASASSSSPSGSASASASVASPTVTVQPPASEAGTGGAGGGSYQPPTVPLEEGEGKTKRG